MLNQIKTLFGLDEKVQAPSSDVLHDKNIAAGALMVHVIAADGNITEEEQAKLSQILHDHYAVSADEAQALDAASKSAQSAATDLYGFTSLLKRELDEQERILLVEDLWEMVFADGAVHEFEDNVVWRVAELLGVSSRHRMELKQRVKARLQES